MKLKLITNKNGELNMSYIKGTLTISRPTYGSGEEYVEIEIVDESSRVQFLRIKIDYADFTRALTGQSFIPVIFEGRHLDKVGLKKETKPLVFPVPSFMSGKDYAKENCQKFADEGWTADGYYNSQGSLKKVDEEKYEAHGSQHRYVKIKE
jgi:hypothetical protein